MENGKVSKKALNNLISDSLNSAITQLALPKPTKRVRKILNNSSKKLAVTFAGILKKQNKKSKKERKKLLFVGGVRENKKNSKAKLVAPKNPQVAH